jgi:hypothetical protein
LLGPSNLLNVATMQKPSPEIAARRAWVLVDTARLFGLTKFGGRNRPLGVAR